MKNIRSEVFETNSSSTHSIAIANDADGILDTLVPDDMGTVILAGGEFGWSWDKFNDAYTKANYCAVDAKNNPAKIRMLIDAITQHTGAKKVSIIIDNNSYIDHQSVGTSVDAFADLDVLINFIFNPKSWLFTGNDNEHPPPNFYDVSSDIVYTHELSIDGVIKTAKFTSMPKGQELEEALYTLCQKHPDCQWNTSYDEDDDEPFQIIEWEQKSPDGSTFSSWSSLKNSEIVIYKIKTVYSEDEENRYLGEIVTDSKQIKFNIKQI